MATKTLKKAAAPTPTTQAEAEAYARRTLETMVKNGVAARDKFVADLATNLYEITERLSWLNDPARIIYVGALAQTALAIAAEGEHALERALQYVVEQETRYMLSNNYRGGSSHDFHNATDAAKREGSARFIEETRWVLQELADARAFVEVL